MLIKAFRIDDDNTVIVNDIDQLEKNKDQLEENKEILSVKIYNFKSNMSHKLDSFINMVKIMAQKSGKIIEENGGMGVVVIESNKMLDNFSNSKSVFSPTLSNNIIKTIRPIIEYMKSNTNSIISQNKSVIPMLEKLCSNLDNNLEKSESRYEKLIKYASKMKKKLGLPNIRNIFNRNGGKRFKSNKLLILHKNKKAKKTRKIKKMAGGFGGLLEMLVGLFVLVVLIGANVGCCYLNEYLCAFCTGINIIIFGLIFFLVEA